MSESKIDPKYAVRAGKQGPTQDPGQGCQWMQDPDDAGLWHPVLIDHELVYRDEELWEVPARPAAQTKRPAASGQAQQDKPTGSVQRKKKKGGGKIISTAVIVVVLAILLVVGHDTVPGVIRQNVFHCVSSREDAASVTHRGGLTVLTAYVTDKDELVVSEVVQGISSYVYDTGISLTDECPQIDLRWQSGAVKAPDKKNQLPDLIITSGSNVTFLVNLGPNKLMRVKNSSTDSFFPNGIPTPTPNH